MTADPMIENETPLELIDGALADTGSIHRRAALGTLSEEDGRALRNRVRDRLKALRDLLLDAEADEEAVILTDAGAAAAVALSVGQAPGVRELIRRIPGLMTARMLADHPGLKRARLYGPFAAIDGGRS